MQLLIANGMDGGLGVPAQLLVAKGNGRETDLNHPQNTVELNAMAILWTRKFVTTTCLHPAVSFCTQPGVSEITENLNI